MEGWMNERMHEWMTGWIKELMNEWIHDLGKVRNSSVEL